LKRHLVMLAVCRTQRNTGWSYCHSFYLLLLILHLTFPASVLTYTNLRQSDHITSFVASLHRIHELIKEFLKDFPFNLLHDDPSVNAWSHLHVTLALCFCTSKFQCSGLEIRQEFALIVGSGNTVTHVSCTRICVIVGSGNIVTHVSCSTYTWCDNHWARSKISTLKIRLTLFLSIRRD